MPEGPFSQIGAHLLIRSANFSVKLKIQFVIPVSHSSAMKIQCSKQSIT